MWKDHLFISLAIEHYNPLGAIRALGEAGIRPVFIGIKGRARCASPSRYISKLHQVETIEEAYEVLMKNYGDVYQKTGKKPYIICSDDKSIGFLDEHYEEVQSRFISYNAGKPNRINDYMDKFEILELAKKYGLNVMKSVVVKCGTMPEGLKYPVITKDITPNSGAWKGDVFICQTPEELKTAFTKIKSEDVLVQEYLSKENEWAIEGCSVNHGKDVFYSIYSTYNYIIEGYYSPYRKCGVSNRPDLEGPLDKMFAEIGFDGIFDAEFLIGKDGKYYFTEINFRNTAWAYSSAVIGMPLPPIWAESMEKGHIVEWAKENKKKYKGTFNAVAEPIDYEMRVRRGNVSPIRWFFQMLGSKCTDYFNWRDLKPWFFMLKNFKKLG